MFVEELNREQLNQLKEMYLMELEDTGDIDDMLEGEEITDAHDIPDEVIFSHYEDVYFVEEYFY